MRRAHVVGHDFGGPWALSWTAGHPERVLSLTLVNIGLMPGYRWHYLARIWRLPLVGEIFMATSTRSAFRMLMKPGNPRGLPKAFVDGMYDNFDRGTRRAVLRLYRATPDPGGLSETLGDALRPLDIPTLVIWGAADPYVPVRFAEVQREFFPAARIVRFDDSGHWPHVDAPERFASELVTFLRDQCGQS